MSSVILCNSHVLKINPTEEKSICNENFTRFLEIESNNSIKQDVDSLQHIQSLVFNGERNSPSVEKWSRTFNRQLFLLSKNRLGVFSSIYNTNFRKIIVSCYRCLRGTTHIHYRSRSILKCRSITFIYDVGINETINPSHLMYGCQILSQKSKSKTKNKNILT